MRPERHSFVRLSGTLTGEAGEWAAAGRWFVVAASHPGDDLATVRLGLATPDKRRIGLHLPLDRLTDLRPPPGLDEIDHTPWADRLTQLRAIGPMRAYGSAAWQALTGLPYLRAGSDLDLLVADPALVPAVLALPQTPRLDGEVLLPDGRAVALREYGAARRIVKGHGGPWLEAA
ncbi:malonate decarboxylase holo-[acyl-carrier-protein] synthase [Cereibacter sp. SYSU M97828]|nr:malonate decarboxylase holo-[acyl-carrier-protein] synthase [Cereibacter flavus]